MIGDVRERIEVPTGLLEVYRARPQLVREQLVDERTVEMELTLEGESEPRRCEIRVRTVRQLAAYDLHPSLGWGAGYVDHKGGR